MCLITDPVNTPQKVMKISVERPSPDAYFMEIAEVVSKRSTCLRHKNGAVLVRDKHILSTGYNGAPRGLPHCSEVGCLREELKIPSGQRHELCRGAHAEANAIIQAALHEISTADSIMYSTHQPCILCAKLIINAQVTEVVFKTHYADELAVSLLKRAGVKLRKFKDKEG
jgi:dCMP deaminase